MKMKKEFIGTMKNGTEEEKKEQWKKFGEKLAEFGEHAKEWQPEYGQDWRRARRGKDFGPDGEGNSWNSQRAKIISTPCFL